MIRTQIYIPDELYREAKLYAQVTGKSISDFMREGLTFIIKKKKKSALKNKKVTLLDIAGIIKIPGKKKTNIAATHNDIYDL